MLVTPVVGQADPPHSALVIRSSCSRLLCRKYLHDELPALNTRQTAAYKKIFHAKIFITVNQC
jgi:hypothetical protein